MVSTRLLDEQMHKTVVDALYAGASLDVAAATAGIPTTLLKRWMRRGRAAPHGRCRDLYTAVRKAQAAVELRHLASIHQRAINGKGERVKRSEKADGRSCTETVTEVKGDWRASAWLLTRINPRRYARTPEAPRDEAVESVIVGFNPPGYVNNPSGPLQPYDIDNEDDLGADEADFDLDE